MNERLIEIAKKAMVEHCVSHVRLEKFAELIIRECAAYAFSDDQDHKAMLNHFGVKE